MNHFFRQHELYKRSVFVERLPGALHVDEI